MMTDASFTKTHTVSSYLRPKISSSSSSNSSSISSKTTIKTRITTRYEREGRGAWGVGLFSLRARKHTLEHDSRSTFSLSQQNWGNWDNNQNNQNNQQQVNESLVGGGWHFLSHPSIHLSIHPSPSLPSSSCSTPPAEPKPKPAGVAVVKMHGVMWYTAWRERERAPWACKTKKDHGLTKERKTSCLFTLPSSHPTPPPAPPARPPPAPTRAGAGVVYPYPRPAGQAAPRPAG